MIFSYLLGLNGTESTITAVIYWPIVPALDDCGAISRKNEWQGKPKCPEEACPAVLCPPQIPHVCVCVTLICKVQSRVV
jgi:hypothetical protein